MTKTGVEEQAQSAGAAAERLVYERLRTALPATYRLYPSVHWNLRDGSRLRSGEADLLVAHPDLGFLVIEVKAGRIRRDKEGWWAGPERLPRSPFEQAEDSRHSLVRKLRELRDWPPHLKPIAGHAVAFPEVDLDSAGATLGLLGPEFDRGLVLDRPLVADTAGAHAKAWIDAVFAAWGQGGDTRPPGPTGIRVLEGWLTDPIELRSLLRTEIAEGTRETVRLTEGQLHTLRQMRRNRRVAIRGGAGTGKTMLAAEKARQLVREGYRTLLVCFNSPLARMLQEETLDVASTGLLTVSTFHQLCEDLGREAGTLPSKPEPVNQDWWDTLLPGALDDAIAAGAGGFHAVVVDEGQDFAPEWLLSLDELLVAPKEDVLYVFHDPAQAIFRDDAVADLQLETTLELDYNCRNARPIHDVVARLSEGGLGSEALRTDGRAPELIDAATEDATLEALRVLLHRLRNDEGVNPWDIAVLTGRSLSDSAVWRQRRFGNEVLVNPAVDDAGRALGLASRDIPEAPSDGILCDSIRRFKGLERPVIVLLELKPDDKRLARLLYVGASRARQHLAVIAARDVLERLT
jgi:hypothetical protein